ncbi:MazG nucleotide pyrophosphohydrolase domain-containing protein [Scopulibacillus daqui]|nr:nucleoside triphosphate pyrophosphohydrolase [Scopulibacillus daqui]
MNLWERKKELKAAIYNKLVRDKIPEVIEKTGKNYKIVHLNNEKYQEALKNKLIEEANEAAGCITQSEMAEELADCLEVIAALAEAYGIPMEKVEEMRCKKAEKRGRFSEKIVLIEAGD